MSEDSRCRVEEVTRVVLRPIASPLPLAFLSFGVGCGLQLGLFPQPAMPNVAVLFGGVVLPAMLVAGILAFLSQETWGRRCSA